VRRKSPLKTPQTGNEIRKIALAGIACAALAVAPVTSADPTAGHDAKVNIQTPRMLCEIGSDDNGPGYASPAGTGPVVPGGMGPSVVCQGSFPQAPPDQDQAVVNAAGQFSYRTANIGVGYPHAPFDTLVPGQTYHIQGWSIAASGDGITFTDDGTGHGMLVSASGSVQAF
jgi:hypothetical protein